jgi:hypothetical protein
MQAWQYCFLYVKNEESGKKVAFQEFYWKLCRRFIKVNINETGQET